LNLEPRIIKTTEKSSIFLGDLDFKKIQYNILDPSYQCIANFKSYLYHFFNKLYIMIDKFGRICKLFIEFSLLLAVYLPYYLSLNQRSRKYLLYLYNKKNKSIGSL